MNARQLDPVTDPRWAALVARTRGGLFHSPPWLGAVQDAYGFGLRAAVVLDAQGEPVAGIPFALLDGPPGSRVVAAPFCDSCDPLGASPPELDVLLDALTGYDVPVLLRFLDAPHPEAPRFAVTKRARWHSLPLATAEETRWRALAPAARRAIQKARREGIDVRPLRPGADLAAFHRLHVALRKEKYRLLAQPLAFFEAIAARFGPRDGWHALGAWHAGRLVAGTIYLRWGDTLYYKFNASAPDALEHRPNSLLVWEGMTLASTLGCTHLDLGPSDDDQPGLIRFKRQFGADERELRFLRRDPDGWDDAPAARLRILLGEVTRLCTAPEVPLGVAGDAGAAIYRYFA